MKGTVLVYQRLTVEWGRAGQTAALTARRRDLPRTFPLPPLTLPDHVTALAHTVTWTDADGFTLPTETLHQYATPHALPTPDMTVERTTPDDGYALHPAPHLTPNGTPHRFHLNTGQLARFEWNEHLPGEPARVRHTILSVSLSPHPVLPEVLCRLPDLYRSHMLDLNERRNRHHAEAVRR